MCEKWELPNPFLRPDGTLVESAEEWPAQRQYLRDVLESDLYGKRPPAPGNIIETKLSERTMWDGTGLFEVYELAFGPEHAVRMRVVVIRANTEEKQIPIVFCGGYVDEAIARMAVSKGFLIATPMADDCAPDNPQYQEGSLYKAYSEWGFKVIGMWGWLMSRVIDWLETKDYADMDKVVAAGHSRYGKATLACSVFDDRVKVSAPGGSGCGGIGSLRVAGGRYGEGIGDVETLGGMITGYFPHWFVDSLIPYGAKEASAHNRENELRFDANFMGAAIAPRALLLVEGLDDTWANPYGTQASWNASAEVFHFLGADEKCAIHFREGGHAYNMEDWTVMLDFARVQLLGTPKETNYKTRSADELPLSRSWKAPGPEEAPAPEDNFFAPTPERVAAMKAMINNRWLFSEEGLDNGIIQMIKGILAKFEE